MQITLENTRLADPNLALGLIGPSGLTLNGQQIVDDAQFFRAATAGYFARGNFSTTLQFSVSRFFPTIKDAEVFALTHAGSVPRSGIVTAVCGETGHEQICYLAGAVLESLAITKHLGVFIVVQYTIRGGLWTTDVPPDLPGESEAAEDFIVMRRGKVAIAEAADHVDVVFSSPLSAVPTIPKPGISRPTGGDNIEAYIREDTVTANGFTADLSGAPPASGYVLHYIAVE